MDTSFAIASARDDTRLVFSSVSADSFVARIESRKYSAEASVSTYVCGPPSSLFRDMARDWDGWTGTKEWASLEDELRLQATIDLTGHVSLRTIFRDCCSPADWRFEATIPIDAGSLAVISRSVDRLFAPTKPVEPTG